MKNAVPLWPQAPCLKARFPPHRFRRLRNSSERGEGQKINQYLIKKIIEPSLHMSSRQVDRIVNTLTKCLGRQFLNCILCTECQVAVSLCPTDMQLSQLSTPQRRAALLLSSFIFIRHCQRLTIYVWNSQLYKSIFFTVDRKTTLNFSFLPRSCVATI